MVRAVRILMLSWELPPTSSGGMAAHVDGLAHALAAGGDDVVVITRRDDRQLERDSTLAGVRILRAEVDLPWLPDRAIARVASANHAMVAASTALEQWRPDVVHAHDWQVAWAAQVLSHLHGVPVVTTFHGTERSRHGGHVPPGVPTDVNGVEWWAAVNSRHVIAITGLLARQVIGDFELDPAVVHPIIGGIDPAWWRTVGADEAAPAPDDPPLILTWGRVQYEKGFQVLIDAMAAVRTRVPEARCMIAGHGTYSAELQSRVDVAGLSDAIDLPGWLDDNRLRAAVHRADCVVIPSLYEPFGVVALEALAGGGPLVVAATGGLAEVIGDSGAALTFEPGNAAMLADRIVAALSDVDFGDDLRRRGAALVDNYTWAAVADRTRRVYTAAIG